MLQWFPRGGWNPPSTHAGRAQMSTTSPLATPGASFVALPFLVRRAAVLGAGTMGSRIAAHLANAGIPTLLLDLPPKDQTAERAPAVAALDALAKSKPARFFEASLSRLITPGTFDDDLPRISECDWVVEAVAENLEIKTALLTRVLPHLGAHAILTTNTSGLPIARIAGKEMKDPPPAIALIHPAMKEAATSQR